MATIRRPRSDIKADSELVEKLDSLKRDFGETSRTGTIRRLIDFHEERKTSKEGLSVATPEAMKDDRPVLITGSSGAGKTRNIKALIEG